jgi:DDE superfamily endonuclease
MMTLRSLRRHPAVLKALTGLSVTVFDALLTEALPALAAAEQHRLSRPHRQRAIGGGHPYALAPAEQVLAAVIWLRLYPTDRVLGWLFGIEETSVRRLRSRVVPVLVGLGNATLVLPDPGRRLDQAGLLAAVPELAVIVDTYEQPVQRPKGRTSPDRWYSGKKKQHTGKVQVLVVETTGQFVAVSETKPGPTNDLALLRESGVLERLSPEVAILGDLAYVGIAKLHKGGQTARRKPRSKPRPAEDVPHNRAFARRRVVVEHSLQRLRRFACVTERDRHHRVDDGRAVACAGLVNRQLRHQASQC